jgi:hypothetical protein
MNGFKLPVISLKKAALIVLGLLVVWVAVWVVRGYMSTSLGLTGMVSSPMAPQIVLDRYEESGVSSGGYARDADMMYVANKTASIGIMPPVPSPTPTAPQGVSRIVKEGELSLLVKNVDDAAVAVTQLRLRMNGEQGDATFTEYRPGFRSGSVTIWVPSARFEEAMDALKKLAIRVENEAVHTTDVSTQYVDTEARLKNLRVTEAQYTEIMKRAGTIPEVLSVAQALSNTRTEIERLQAQLDLLSRRVALSSIRITLMQEAQPSSVTDEWRPATVAREALKQTLNKLTDLADGTIVFLIMLPILLLEIGIWVLVFWVLWKIGRALYRRFGPHTDHPVS